MTREERLAVPALVLIAAVLVVPPASARAGGPGPVAFHLGGYYGYGFGPNFAQGWGWGWGWGPQYWPPYGPSAYRPVGSLDLGVVTMAGVGAVDVDARPARAEVWVDGRYVGEAHDFDGHPSLLWLEEGEHTLAFFKGGYRALEEKVEVRRGVRTRVKVRLERGASEPPTGQP